MCPPAPAILGVAEVVLNARDLPALRDFYTRTLGFTVAAEECHETSAGHDPQGQPTICFLKIADSQTPLGADRHPPFLVLIDYRRHASARARGISDPIPSASGLNHLAFEISPDSYAAHRDHLKQLGLQPTETQFPNLNARALFFEDPEGNTLELIARSEADH